MDFIIPVAIKLTIGFIALVVFMNLNGRSQLAPTSTEDQIGNYVLGGIIGGVIYNPSITIVQFLIVLLIWGVLMTTIDFLKNSNKNVKKMIDGQIVYLIKGGKMLTENFAQATLSIPDFYTKLRTKGIFKISDIEDAFMESNGQLIVIQKNDENYSNLLISEGKILEENLEHIGKDDKWLQEELEKYNISDINDIFLVEYSNDDKLFIVKK
ncbi:hypothetical protein JMUB4039_1542 [Leptotrichia trevisanii]|uniref:Uncharacterized protein n=1 Tax=Leptotrichia trevisanii TaxID=109328 RepID=A0A510L0Q7_9FUSO|nr:DUF421 domain-containing protein [Leptotrichia trevisanii]BBM52768.1 hypothetical protein JMUB3935_1748 [Leptotrichia trevisanii]BBM57562.1 hypothetical protein JMUB4039_1542 [Leptotrichia trevisanii]